MPESGAANGKDYGDNRSCWQRLGETRQCQVGTIVLFILIIIALAVYIGVKATAKTAVGNQNICMTRECIESANTIASYMDTSVDPCHNFYDFVCGNYIKKNKGSEKDLFSALGDSARVAVKNVLMEAVDPNESPIAAIVKTAFQSCISGLEGSEPPWKKLRKALNENGFQYWPEALENWNDRFFDFTTVLSSTLAAGFKTIIYFEKSSETTPHIEIHPGQSLWVRFSNIRDDYHKLMVEIFEGLEVPNAERVADDVLDFEKRLMTLHKVSNDPELLKTSDVARRYPDWNFTRLMTQFWNKLQIQGANKDPEDFVFAVKADDLMRRAPGLLAVTPKRTVLSYMAWKFLFDAIEFSNLELRARRLTLSLHAFKYSFGVLTFPVWKTCLSEVTEPMVRAVTFVYVRDMFSSAMQQGANFYLDSVKKAFKKKVPDQMWLDRQTRQSVMNKIDNLSTIIGYPKEEVTEKSISNLYESIQIEKGNFISNLISLKHFAIAMEYMEIGPPGFKLEWIYNPTDVNAMNTQEVNQIVIPIGILYPPFLQLNRPQYLNFASMGFTVAHELGHTFDTSGIKVNYAKDEVGWSPEMRQRHQDKSQCFVKQYSKYYFDGEGVLAEGVFLNGNKTIDDNIADHIGLLYAYRAFLEYQASHPVEPLLPGLNYNQNQLFFIQFGQVLCATYSESSARDDVGDEHVPNRFRVNGPASNNAAFAEVFHCPKGSPMEREDKCDLFN